MAGPLVVEDKDPRIDGLGFVPFGFGDPNLMGLMTLTLGVRGTMDFGANQ